MGKRSATPVYRDGTRVRINGMAASSIANKLYDVSRCDECGSFVAWAQSKSGGWYLCTTLEYTTEGGHERFRAAPWIRHECGEIIYEVWAPEDFFARAEFDSYEEAWAYIVEAARSVGEAGSSILEWLDTDEADALSEKGRSTMHDLAMGNLVNAANIQNSWKIRETRRENR